MTGTQPNWLSILMEGFQKQLADQAATNERRHTENLERMNGIRDDIARIEAQIIPVPELAKEVENLKGERYTRKGVLIGLGALGGGGAVAYGKTALAWLGFLKP